MLAQWWRFVHVSSMVAGCTCQLSGGGLYMLAQWWRAVHVSSVVACCTC